MTRDYTFLNILKKEKIKKNDIQGFAAQMENAVNSFGFPKNQVCELLTIDTVTAENFLKISLAWIQNLATRAEWQYDGRNEASVRIAKKFIGELKLEKYIDDTAITFAREASSWHRTLQQTFSGLVFLFLDKMESGGFIDSFSGNINRMRVEYGEKWYGLPMI